MARSRESAEAHRLLKYLEQQFPGLVNDATDVPLQEPTNLSTDVQTQLDIINDGAATRAQKIAAIRELFRLRGLP